MKLRQVGAPCLVQRGVPFGAETKHRVLIVGRETQITGCSDIARQAKKKASLGCLLVCMLLEIGKNFNMLCRPSKTHLQSRWGLRGASLGLWLRKKMLEQSRHLVMAVSY